MTHDKLIIVKSIIDELAKHINHPTNEIRAMVLAQLDYESGGFLHTEEKLNYTVKGLIDTWPNKFNKKNVAYYVGHPERIANVAYANRNGNGSALTGDGWKYRGRGFVQLTGKYNYDKYLAGLNPDDMSKSLLINVKVSVAFVCGLKGFEVAASKGDVYTCTKLINGGQNGLKNRTNLYKVYLNMLTKKEI